MRRCFGFIYGGGMVGKGGFEFIIWLLILCV